MNNWGVGQSSGCKIGYIGVYTTPFQYQHDQVVRKTGWAVETAWFFQKLTMGLGGWNISTQSSG